MRSPKVENFVICEDFRTEARGKHILLGASAPELNVAQMPANIPVALWLDLQPYDKGPFNGDFRATDPKGGILIKAKVGFSFENMDKSSIVIGPFPLSVKEPGEYTFQWKLDNKNWVTIAHLLLKFSGSPQKANPAPTS